MTILYLSSDDDDFEQLQDEFIRLAALRVVFITWAHKEVFQLPAKGLLSWIDPMACCCSWKLVVAISAAVIVMFPAAVCGAIECHRAGQIVLL